MVQDDLAGKSGRHALPAFIGRVMVVDVYNIDIVELPPWNTSPVHVSDTVSR